MRLIVPKKIFFSCLFLLFFMMAQLLSARQYFNPINYEAYQGYKGAGNFVENSTYAGDVTGYLLGITIGIVVSEPLRLFNYDYEGDDIAAYIISGCVKGFGATFGGPSYFFHWMFYGTPKPEIVKPKKIVVNPKLLTAKEKKEDTVAEKTASRIKLSKVNRPISKTETAVPKSKQTESTKQEANKTKESKLTEREKRAVTEHKKVEEKVSNMEMTKQEKIDLGLLPEPESKEDIQVSKRIGTLDKTDTEAAEEGKLQDTQPASWNTPELPDWVKKQMGQ